MMENLLTALSAYFDADTPQRRINALTVLTEAFDQARQSLELARQSHTITLPGQAWADYQEIAEKAQLDSVQVLLREIAAHPPLIEKIVSFLAAPVIEPVNSLPDILIRPEKPKSQTIARISVTPEAVLIDFPEKRKDFREIVKFGMGYDWNDNAWAKSVAGWAEATNRAAEVGHRLLAEGFWVAPPTREVQELIVNEEYEGEKRRKVMVVKSGQYENWFLIWWEREEDCYDVAKKITASRYYKPSVVVPPEHYDEVLDFAERHSFYVTPAAQRLADEARTRIEAALLLTVNNVEVDRVDVPGNGRPVLEALEEVGIDEELLDV